MVGEIINDYRRILIVVNCHDVCTNVVDRKIKINSINLLKLNKWKQIEKEQRYICYLQKMQVVSHFIN